MIDSQAVIQILALREAGYCINEIAERHNVSQSCVKQICKKYGAHKGSARTLYVEKAKQQIIEDAKLTERIVLETSAAILLELDLSKQIKTAASLLLEQLSDNQHGITVATRARSLAAVSTAVSVAQSITHKALELQKSANETSADDLPSLTISSYNDEEIEGEFKQTSSKFHEIFINARNSKGLNGIRTSQI